jgi:hypothetical protein
MKSLPGLIFIRRSMISLYYIRPKLTSLVYRVNRFAGVLKFDLGVFRLKFPGISDFQLY